MHDPQEGASMMLRQLAVSVLAIGVLLTTTEVRSADTADDAALATIRQGEEQIVKAFNAGKADELAGLFLPKGEIIDEAGTVYQGSQEIKDLFTAFFQKFAGTKLSINVESVRVVGPVAIDEGTRTMSAPDGAVQSQFRYIAVWAKNEKGWRVASYRDFADDPAPTPNDNLQALAWLVGDWLNEGADARVSISYHWSEDKNFLLGEFEVRSADGTPRKTTQRIGWDPSAGKIRSWLFDSDGGFAQGVWTIVDEGAVIKSESVNPDGSTASATMHITLQDKDHYKIEGTDRIVGDALDEDFELTVTRRPPPASK
jgi:uncharacterized protein (TIGR02246 family)